MKRSLHHTFGGFFSTATTLMSGFGRGAGIRRPQSEKQGLEIWKLSKIHLWAVAAVLPLLLSAQAVPQRAAEPADPAAAASAAFQPCLPIRAAFYYPWYPGHWGEGHVERPVLGEYRSTDTTVIDWHLAWAKYAHLDAYVTSWWGRNDSFGTDAALPVLLQRTTQGDAYPDLRWSVYYEMESVTDPTPSEIASDLRYLLRRAFNSPAYLRYAGAPVIFVYGAGPDVSARWQAAKALYGRPLVVVLQVYDGWQQDPNQPDAWHQYDPVEYMNGAAYPYSVSVSPGFQKPGEAPRLQRDSAAFESAVQTMVASNAPLQLVTTFSEWGEGTQVEPSWEHDPDELYLDILRRNLPESTCPR